MSKKNLIYRTFGIILFLLSFLTSTTTFAVVHEESTRPQRLKNPATGVSTTETTEEDDGAGEHTEIDPLPFAIGSEILQAYEFGHHGDSQLCSALSTVEDLVNGESIHLLADSFDVFVFTHHDRRAVVAVRRGQVFCTATSTTSTASGWPSWE